MKSFGKVKYRRYAFTLAEVLITITVIGVVAALTIPNLVNNYQNKAWNTASAVFQRKLGEALKVMNSQGTLAGYSSTEDFVNELSKHIKINKICKNDEITSCFEDTVFWGNDNKEIDMKKIKLAANLGHSEWITNTLGVMFADGVSGIIAYNPECSQDPYRTDVITVSDTGIGTDCLAILYDTSGFKKPNTQSKDLRGLNVLSLDGESCVYQLPNGTCYTMAFQPKPHIWNACTSDYTSTDPEDLAFMAQYNIQIGCYPGNDYWAGAVEQCGGTDNMPTFQQLNDLGSYVYNTSISGTGIIYNLTLDENKLAELGIPVGVSVWSNQRFYADSVYRRQYSKTNSLANGRTKNDSTLYAFCLVK